MPITDTASRAWPSRTMQRRATARLSPLKCGLACSMLALAACASTPIPNESLAVAQAAVNRASNTAVREAAPAELQIAIAKLASSKTALAAGQTENARWLAEQASLDAQVAEQQAQAVRSRKAAQESEAAATALNEELKRKTPR